jgi:hypothetical protein
MITPVIPTRRARPSAGGLALAVALVAVLGAAYIAYELPLGDEAITQSTATDSRVHAARRP